MAASKREQPHVIADRVSKRIAANRLRISLGLKPVPVTTSPAYSGSRRSRQEGSAGE